MPHTPAVIDIESQVVDPLDYTKEEAKQATDEINALWSPAEEAIIAIRKRIYECHKHNAWRSLGYASWDEYCELAFPKLTKSTVFRSLLYTSFEAETPKLAGIPASHAAVLMDVPAAERVDAYEIAKQVAGKEKPTVREVRKAVMAVQDAAAEANADTATENPPARPSSMYAGKPRVKREPTDEERDARAVAIGMLKQKLSKTAIKAVIDETVELTVADLAFWSSLDDPAAIENLVIGSRLMRPKQAWEWSQRMVTEKTPVSDLVNRALLTGDGLFSASIDGSLVVVASTPALRKSLAAWLSANE